MKKRIALFVLFSHFLIAVVLVFHHALSENKKPTKPISIRTVSPPSVPQPVLRKSTTIQPAKRTKNNAPARKKSAAPSAPKRENTALKELAAHLQSLATPPPISSSSLPVPSALQQKKRAEIEKGTSPLSYRETLSSFLEQALDLPEYGEVKVLLEIAPNGALYRCEILDWQSRKNCEFLKNRLPELTFPCFNASTTPVVFTIVFRNAAAPS